MNKVFIDGSAGTTGLRIYERLKERKDIELIILSEEKRKDTEARKEAFAKADIAFLCLPDAAAIEAVGLIDNDKTVVIDTSTAHRTAPGWVYGMPELTGQKEKIKTAKRIANPGCHASGFIALVAPLVQAGILPKDAMLNAFSLTGYSGGGKKMIAEYEGEEVPALYDAPRQYGLTQKHKHLPEMQIVSGLSEAPCFCPIVADFYSGMEVTVPIFASQLQNVAGAVSPIEAIGQVYKAYYGTKGDDAETEHTGCIYFEGNADESGFLSAAAMSGSDEMQISVQGNDERILLVSRFDNLGKGASGAAIQNMNIVLGVAEKEGLVTN